MDNSMHVRYSLKSFDDGGRRACCCMHATFVQDIDPCLVERQYPTAIRLRLARNGKLFVVEELACCFGTHLDKLYYLDEIGPCFTLYS